MTTPSSTDAVAYTWTKATGGHIIPEADALIPVRAHGISYGTVFEGIAVQTAASESISWFQTGTDAESNWGRVIYRLDSYLDRFYRGIKQVLHASTDGLDSQLLTAAIIEVLQRNPVTDNYVRPIALLGAPETRSFGLDPARYDLMVVIESGSFRIKHPRDNPAEGWHFMISSHRRPAPDQGHPALKSSSNYALGMQLIAEAHAAGYDGALLLSPNGRWIAEAEVANLFAIFDDEIATPDLESGCLPGITRQGMIDVIYRLLGQKFMFNDQLLTVPTKFNERKIAAHELFIADGLFATGSATFVRDITQLNHRPIGTGRPHPVSQFLQRELWKCVTGRDGDLQKITFIPPGEHQICPPPTTPCLMYATH